jgi:type II secretory pathway pseudopilin PulG
MIVVIIVIGILASVAMKSMDTAIEDARRVQTEREMEMLAQAIAGNPQAVQAGLRADFGYVGDVGSFPPNLSALTQNPGGLTTWNGPYIEFGYAEDNSGFRLDEWGKAYGYDGALTITSSGGGITRRLAGDVGDYLLNQMRGSIEDAGGSPPGAGLADSINILITVPNGAGGLSTKAYHPDSSGTFTLDSLPVGEHRLDIVFTPWADTLRRFVTILPGNKLEYNYRFAERCF